MPFGITSAPEVYQKRMNDILDGLPGVACLIKDTVIFEQDQEEHDQRSRAVLWRLDEANVTLTEICAFSSHKVVFRACTG